MSSISLQPANKANENDSRWQIGWVDNRPMRWTVIFSVGLLIATIIGLIFDQRTLIGEPIWIKPTKFAISSVFYSLSFLWLLTYIDNYPRIIRLVSWVTATALFVELVLIAMQAYRGVRSHFNTATAFDMAVFSIMGTMIMALWIASLVALIILIRQRFADRVWGSALKWALFLTVVGSGLGFLMTSPNSAQLEAAIETGVLPESGAHSVGVPDGGEGLPFVGWSTEGGDLRIGHFIGLHALQVIPLLGLFIIWSNRNRSIQQQINLIHIAGVGYLGLVGIITWQALRGEPLIYPSGLTLTVAGIFVALLIGTTVFALSNRASRQ